MPHPRFVFFHRFAPPISLQAACCFVAFLMAFWSGWLCAAPSTSKTAKHPTAAKAHLKHDTNTSGRAAKNRGVAGGKAPLAKPVATRARPLSTWRVLAPLHIAALLLAAGMVFITERANRKSERRGAMKRGVVWALCLSLTRALLLTVLLAPAALHWHALARDFQIPALAAAICASALAAIAVLGLCHWRTRGSRALALLLCSGAAIATLFLLLMRETQSLNAFDAGYFGGAALVCGSAWSASEVFFGRTLFEIPRLEHRAVSPLAEPYAPGTRAQLRLVSLCVIVSLALALMGINASGAALAAIAAISFAAALYVRGWRSKQLGAKQIVAALLWSALATIVLAMLTGLVVLPEPQKILNLRLSDAMSFAGGVRARAMPVISFGLMLCVAAFLLRRPPAHLWTVLARAPFWGWLLLATLLAATATTLFSVHGHEIALGLCSMILPAWALVWLEGAEK